MPRVQDFFDALNRLAPFSLAESWDNVGLLIGDDAAQVNSALLAMDATDAVIDEAVDRGANLLITHHPVIFNPIKAIRGGSIVYRLVREGISVISAHTNLDIAGEGVNDQLAKRLGLTELRGLDTISEQPYYKVAVTVPAADADKVYDAMCAQGAGVQGNYSHCGFFVQGEGRFKPLEGASPHIGAVDRLERVEEMRLEMLVAPEQLNAVVSAMKNAHPYEEAAYDVFRNYACKSEASLGRVGRLSKALSPRELAVLVKESLGTGGVKYVAGSSRIDTVAVGGGSCADLVYAAKAKGAQALVTGESKYNLLLDAQRLGITLIDAGHFATEVVVLQPLLERLQKELDGAAISIAQSDGSPIQYI